ncbi:MAG: class I SAM-dependent methyltransferase [Bacteroidales bacterium]|nr:class I SAM-dependent methyltransferase [Bacteroidales bacterium]
MTIERPEAAWQDYELIDSGDFSKLERWGPYITIRPEPKALWPKSMGDAEWRRLAHTEFKPGAGFGKAGKEDSGTWTMLRNMKEQWTISYPSVGFNLRLGLTSFKHVGVFPEQAPNWNFIYDSVKEVAASRPGTPRVLNLFAYTGAASLAALKAGAAVTHLDAVKQVVTWARGNMELSGMDGIRWIVEDALKFARREARRGNLYQGIILDPPAYGHGPDGERWKLDECLFDLLKECSAILAPRDSFLVLNLYSNGYSAVLADTLVRSAFDTTAARLDYGELVLGDRTGRQLPLSVFSRLKR